MEVLAYFLYVLLFSFGSNIDSRDKPAKIKCGSEAGCIYRSIILFWNDYTPLFFITPFVRFMQSCIYDSTTKSWSISVQISLSVYRCID